MESLSSFYQKRLMGRFVYDEDSKHNIPVTLTIKFGMSKNLPKRGIKAEFLSYANAPTKRNPGAGKYEIIEEIDMLGVDGKHSCCVAPDSFIADWEGFVNTRFYDKCPRLFQNSGKTGSKHEYLETSLEIEARSDYLVKVIKKAAPKLAELKPQYEELTSEDSALGKRIYADYRAIFDSMKKSLNNYGIKSPKKTNLLTQQSVSVTTAQLPTQNGYQDPFVNLAAEWTLCTFTGTTIVGLQHNKEHADQNGNLKTPEQDYNVLLADSAVKGARFQFHSNPFLSGKYRPYNINAARVIDILTKAGKVRVFNITQLPIKGQKMMNKTSATNSSTATNFTPI